MELFLIKCWVLLHLQVTLTGVFTFQRLLQLFVPTSIGSESLSIVGEDEIRMSLFGPEWFFSSLPYGGELRWKPARLRSITRRSYLADKPLPVTLAPLGKLHRPEYFRRFSRPNLGIRGDFQPRLSCLCSVCLSGSVTISLRICASSSAEWYNGNRTSGTASKIRISFMI